jgi:hypothetical protein
MLIPAKCKMAWFAPGLLCLPRKSWCALVGLIAFIYLQLKPLAVSASITD